MTVRSSALRFFSASPFRRRLFGGAVLLSIALSGLYIGTGLSGLHLPGLLTGGRESPDESWVGTTLVPLPLSQAVRPLSAAHLENLLDQADFDLDAVRAGTAQVQGLYVRRLPGDLVSVPETARRKRLFFGAVLPLVLMANQELRTTRSQVLQFRERYSRRVTASEFTPDQPLLDDSERRWLETLHARYGTKPGDWDALLLRLDEVPVSLIMAQAIQESGWGTSRFVRLGNALFGQRTWNAADGGLVPDLRDDGMTHRVKSFPDLMAAVRAYMHNLNTHGAYRKMRLQRAELRQNPVARPGIALAATLTRYSEENKGYVKALTGLIRDNDLSSLNKARLRGSPEQVVSRPDAGV